MEGRLLTFFSFSQIISVEVFNYLDFQIGLSGEMSRGGFAVEVGCCLFIVFDYN